MESSIKFYIKENVKYIIDFPEKWFPHIGNSGPINCEECKMGMINDIFVFYCDECLINVYNYERGSTDYFDLIINEVNFEEYIKLYYKLLNNNIYCYGCSDVLSSEDIKKGYDDKDKNLLCYECKNFPDFENWPPIGY
jgi:hypothetical protein